MPNTPKVVDREALKEFRKRNDQRYVLEGEYSPNTRVGKSDLADNLITKEGLTATNPFIFQSVGSNADVKSGFALLKALRGQSYVLNQLGRVSSSHESYNVTTTFDSATGIFTSVGTTQTAVEVSSGRCFANKVGHKILLKLQIISNPDSVSIKPRAFNDNNGNAGTYITSGSTGFIFVASQEQGSYIGLVEENTVELTALQFRLQCFDLTQMFGAGNEPTTVEEFNRLFPSSYYAYNVGELVSCQASKLITVGYNQFDGNWTIGKINADGTESSNITNCKSDFIRVIPGREYSFESGTLNSAESNGRYVHEYDANKNHIGFKSLGNLSQVIRNITLSDQTCYVRIAYYIANYDFTNNFPTDTSFHLTWSGNKTGFESYSKHEYGLPNEVLRSAGSAYDELKPDGTLIRRIGVVDLGSLTIERYGSKEHTFWVGTASQFNNNLKLNPYGQIPNLLTADYTPRTLANTGSNDVDLSITVHDAQQKLVICDKRYDATTEAGIQAFKSALSGKYLFYELATPVKSDSIAFQENIVIDDWGTMEFISTYPQGNEIFYMKNLKDFLRRIGSREDVNYDPDKIVSQEQLAEALADVDLSDYAEKSMVGFPKIPVPASTTLTANEILAIQKGCQIDGNFLNLIKPTFYPARTGIAGVLSRGMYIGHAPSGNQQIGTYQINEATGVIGLSNPTQDNIDYNNVGKVNNKQIPAYPSDTGTFDLKCVNGTLIWVQE